MSKILVVDDDRIIRVSLRRILEGEGHQVTELCDGAAMMKTLAADRPDLIVLDVLMPGLDGMALAYHLKFESRFKTIPILMLTALTDSQTKRYSRESAVDLFMTKPVDAAALKSGVAELISNKKIRVGANSSPAPRKPQKTGFIKPAMLFIVGLIAVAAMMLNPLGVAHSESLSTQFDPAAASRLADVLFIALVPVAITILFGHTWLLSRLIGKK